MFVTRDNIPGSVPVIWSGKPTVNGDVWESDLTFTVVPAEWFPGLEIGECRRIKINMASGPVLVLPKRSGR
jgi:hypothetical protein